MAKKIKEQDKENSGGPKVWGDPEYPAKDDIYSRDKKERLRDGEDDLSGAGVGRVASGTGEDLDVPGAELDDADEEIGEEDEENNYYSLGGDDHDDLEEDRGD
jgi:hypothetical protein